MWASCIIYLCGLHASCICYLCGLHVRVNWMSYIHYYVKYRLGSSLMLGVIIIICVGGWEIRCKGRHISKLCHYDSCVIMLVVLLMYHFLYIHGLGMHW